ncbi:MAG: MFS transporter [Oscillospiraceae bacterium]|jgi:OFA family oxalate/formate antiporter-like MFS transporter|nr:MFS transporter [Oscillospiraceae bacterium]
MSRATKSLAAGSVLLLFLGIIYVWSVFVAPVATLLNWDTSSVKLTASFMLASFVIGIFVSGQLINRIQPKNVVLCGGLMLAAGILIASTTPVSAPWLIYISYGILGGVGVGIAYNTIITCAQRNFPTRRAVATGISVFAFGLSTVIFAPVAKYFANPDVLGVRGLMRVLAAIFAVSVLVLYRFISLPEEESPKAAASSTSDDPTLAQAFRSKSLYILFAIKFFADGVYLTLNPSFVTIAQDKGLGDSLTTILVMMTGIGSAFGRLIFPLLIAKFGARTAAIICSLGSAVVVVGLALMNGPAIMVCIIFVALFFGGASCYTPILTSDCFGVRNVGSIYSIVMFGYMTTAMVSPLIFKALGVADSPTEFIILACFSVVSAVLAIVLPKKKFRVKA